VLVSVSLILRLGEKTGMDKIGSQEVLLATPRADVRICSFCSPEEIRKCTFDREFTFHAHYKSLYTSRELLEKSAEQPDTNVVLALVEQNHIMDMQCWLTPMLRSGGPIWDRKL
jgi:hypothetical protein